MKKIEATLPYILPPEWALLEQSLIRLMNNAIEPVLTKYVRDDGTILWPTSDEFAGIDGLDDAYESFHNWPLFYLVGGADRLLDISLAEYDAITAQFAKYDCGHGHPMVVKEYEQGYDWFHQGEGYLFFYLLCLAAPNHKKHRERAIRYAGFFLNEDEEAQNYDPERKLIKCAHNGSKGPAYRNFTGRVFPYHDIWEQYGIPFVDLPGIEVLEDLKDPELAKQMGKAMEKRMGHGDSVMNLSATTMVANAYLFTGDKKYKAWVKEYVDAWMARLRENNGVIPDNVGLSGKIGEYNNGKWYGGNYGWTWPHGWLSVGEAVLIAGENATLLEKDSTYLDLPRSQIDVLISKGKRHEGTLRVPYKYGDPGQYSYKPRPWLTNAMMDENGDVLWDDGWFEFQPMNAKFMAHVWYMSMEPADRERVEALRNYDLRDFEQVTHNVNKDLGGNEAAWLSYLAGQYTDYPEEILRHNMAQVYERLAFIREDTQDPKTYSDAYLQERNPLTLEGLVQLTMGGPLPVYNGGLLMVRVRYYDAQRKRPGLPEGVSALVEKLDAHSVQLQLVNLSPSEERSVIVQAGAFGEHLFTDVRYEQYIPGRMVVGKHYFKLNGRAEGRREERVLQINDKYLLVQLQPGCSVKLNAEMCLNVNDPSYKCPPMFEE